MRFWTFAAMMSLAVCRCCGCLGDSPGMPMVLVVGCCFMDVPPWPWPLLFMPRAACTYMPNASWRRRGGKAQGEGYLPPGAKRGRSAAKVCTSEARKTVGKPLALRQGRALSQGLVSLFVRVSAHDYLGGALRGRNGPDG